MKNNLKTKNLIAIIFILFNSIANAQFWTDQNLLFPSANYIVDKIDIVNSSVTWSSGSIGSANYYSRTIDSGVTWSSGAITLTGGVGSTISSITAVNATTAWVSAVGTTVAGNGIWKTTNGGITWVEQTTALFNSSSSFPNFIHFFDSNIGFCQGDGQNGYSEMYTTSDGGTNWIKVPDANIPPHIGYFALSNNYETIGDTIMYVDFGGYFYKSTNNGLNWIAVDTPAANGVTICAFTDQNNGVIMEKSNGNLYKTTDGGITWTSETYTGTLFKGDICYIKGTNQLVSVGSAAGNSGSSYSLDNGSTWITIDSNPKIACEFISTTGFSGGKTTSTTNDGIYKYTETIFELPNTLLDEKFENTSMPSGWTFITNQTNEFYKWTFYDAYDDVEIGTNQVSPPQNEWMITPSYDLSNYSNIYLTVSPWMYINREDFTADNFDVKLIVSTNNGATWTELLTDDTLTLENFDGNLFYDRTISISLHNFCGAGMNNVKIGFQFTSAGNSTKYNGVYLMDIKLSKLCPETSLSTFNNTTISWFPINTFIGTFDIEYGPVGFTQGTGTSVSGLEEITYDFPTSMCKYDCYIRTNCGGTTSNWNKISFLNNIQDLYNTNTTTNSSQINWTGYSTFYDIEYGIGNFALGTGTLISNVPGNSYILNGLIPNTNYKYYVRSNCGGVLGGWKQNTFSTTNLSTNEFTSNSVSIYPNPTKSNINITANNAIQCINVYDTFGRLLKSQKGSSSKELISIEELPNAIYLMEIKTDKVNKTVKIIKE